MKIITVLKDDSAEEIFELFRQAPKGEVIFVLPKKCKAFNTAGHFAAIASEAQATGKTVSVMAVDISTAKLAQEQGLAVVSAGKPKRGTATLATQPPPAAADIQDLSEDAFQDDVVVPQDETMNVTGQDEIVDRASPTAGMHVEGAGGEEIDENADGIPDALTDDESEELSTDTDAGFVSTGMQASHAALAAAMDGLTKSARTKVQVPAPKVRTADVPVRVGDEEVAGQHKGTGPRMGPPQPTDDYIDTMWRDRNQAKGGSNAVLPPTRPQRFVGMKRPRFGGRFSRTVMVSLFIVALLVLGAVVYTVTGSAQVTIVPVSSGVDIQLTVQTSNVFRSVDAEFMKLPGQRFTVNEAATKSEPATGSRDVASKARGTMTVMNEYSSSPQTLIATTRFQDDAGRIYRTVQTITVPGSRLENGKTVPGSIDVGVIADKPGAEYNIPVSEFIVAAFQERGDTERAEKLYGVSTEAMTGGANGPSTVVTQDNYDVALAAAEEQVRQNIQGALSAQAPGMRILAEQKITWNPPIVSARPDDAATEVAITAQGTLETVAFRQSDLDELAQEAIMQQARVVVVPDQLDYSFSDVQYDPDTGTLEFTVRVQGPGYALVDPDEISADIIGKKSAEIRRYFSENEDIQSATLELSPPWVRSVPTDADKVTVQIDYMRP